MTLRSMLISVTLCLAAALPALAAGESPAAPSEDLQTQQEAAPAAPSSENPLSQEAEGRVERTRRDRVAAREAAKVPVPRPQAPRVRTTTLGLAYAPRGAKEGSGFGLEYYSVRPDGRLSGGALWFAGSIAPTPDVDAPVPHWDFTRRGYDSRWGLIYLFGQGEGRVAAIGGVGLSVVRTDYVDTSNVTGWTWNGGDKTHLGLQAQFGALVHLSDTAALRLGYDSQFGPLVGFVLTR